jgi:hypothetical protein
MGDLFRTFSESNPPLGFTHATGTVASNIPRVKDIRHGSFDATGWSAAGQRRNSQAGLTQTMSNVSTGRRASQTRSSPTTESFSRDGGSTIAPIPEVMAQPDEKNILGMPRDSKAVDLTVSGHTLPSPPPKEALHSDPSIPFPNGYQFPPPRSIWKSIQIGLKSFGRFAITPVGFFITIYGLNVVAWGGMLFLLLCNAAPAMCHPSCDDDYSAKKIWLEIDSQILNALFCVTGLGLIPWRFRDLYYLMQYRLQKKESGIRRLAGLNNDWFRLRGSENIPIDFIPKDGIIPEGFAESSFALPVSKSAVPPLTGERAPASAYWKMDFMIWCYVVNTLLQICLCGVMWGLNRFNRPGWTTGLLISLACIVAAAGGIMGFKEGKAVKKIEGVPVSEEDMEILAHANDAEAVATAH